MNDIYTRSKHTHINDKGLVWNTDLIEALELENLLCNKSNDYSYCILY